MKEIKSFVIGSTPFFSDKEGFQSKDLDKLYIMDSWKSTRTNVMAFRKDGIDRFFFKNMTKEEFIQDALNSNVPMRVGKFLVPEFASYLNLTIEDLKQLEGLFDSLDDEHKYEKIIYDSYIENNDFTLTEEQKELAYLEYKKYRNNETQETVAS